MTDRDFDIVIVGAGAAGLAAALAFVRDGYRTALVGALETRRDGRTVALLNGSVRFFEALGVWPALVPYAAPLETMRIIDDTGSLFRPPPASFRAAEIGLDAFGWNIENADLVQQLGQAAKAQSGLTLLDGFATGIESDAERSIVRIDGSEEVLARLCIAADGRKSQLRESVSIEARRWSYPQTAVTALLAHDKPHREISTEFHTRHGPFTLVPLPGKRSSLVWVTSPEEAEALAGLGDASLALRIERQAHSILGAMKIDGARGSFPMTGMSVSRFTAPRLALVGEAAHVFPPIGAQGLNLGLRDVAALRDAVIDAGDSGNDPGSPDALARYQRGRDFDVRLRTAAVDGLNRTLLSGILPADFVRGAGLLSLSQIGPLRRAVMREGVLPRISTPRLMQGAS